MRLVTRVFVSFVAMALPVGCQQVEDQPPTFAFESVLGVSTTEDRVGHPLEGAQLCQMDTENCALSDANGEVSIVLPVGEETAVTLTKEGYLPYLFPLIMGEAGRSAVFVVESSQLAAEQYERVGSEYPMRSQGAVFLKVAPPGFVSGAFDLLDATGPTEFYLDEEALWDPDLEATTAPHGWGGFTEVNPGVLHAKVGGMASGCTARYGWPGDAEDTVRFPVREGYATWISLTCR